MTKDIAISKLKELANGIDEHIRYSHCLLHNSIYTKSELKEILSKISQNKLGREGYLVYEIEALILDSENESNKYVYEKIQLAIDLKGDGVLFTPRARALFMASRGSIIEPGDGDDDIIKREKLQKKFDDERNHTIKTVIIVIIVFIIFYLFFIKKSDNSSVDGYMDYCDQHLCE